MKAFEHFLNSKSIRFKHTKGVSSMTGREFHPYHEIILFLGENASLYTETIRTPIKPNTLIVIPKETYHQFNIIGSPEVYNRCVLHFYDRPEFATLIEKSMGELYVTEVSDTISFYFEKLIKTANVPGKDIENKAILKSVLTLLLDELKHKNFALQNTVSVTPIVTECIHFIQEHIAEKLSLKDIAQTLNVSESLLSHTFKDEMDISIYKYILKKRLVMAFEKISEGAPAAIAATECGFSEYSNFYRQYKKAFGFSPSTKDFTLQNPKQ